MGHVQSTNLDGSCCKAMQQDSRRYHSILYGYMLYVEYSVYIEIYRNIYDIHIYDISI